MKSISFKKVNIGIFIALILLFNVILVIQSGVFAKAPKVEAKADNCYKRTLTVITDEDYNPYSFYDKDGNYSGHDVELINMLANELKMNLNLKFMSWQKGINEITNGHADILMTCDYSDSFEGVDKLLKSEPISTNEFIIYSKKKITSLYELYGKRIGVMQNGNATAGLKRMELLKYSKMYPDNRAAMQALIDGEVDYAIMRQPVGDVLIRELNAKKVKGYISFDISEMCFGITISKPELVGQINEAIETLKMNGQMEKLKNKWLTTFIKPYTLIELVTKNLWIVFLILVLILFATAGIIRNKINVQKAIETQTRNEHVVEQLAKDFGCVNYIEIKDNMQSGPVVNYRVSEKLKQIIPGWENEKSFAHKLELLCDNCVYAPDREKFDHDTKINTVLTALKEENAYYVNTRLFFDNEIRYYQMKFTPVFQKKELKGVVVGLHSVDLNTKTEMELQEQLQQALKKADSANQAKTEFLFNMSHDIRTPLNAILGFTGMSVKYIDNKDKVLECLHKIQLAGNLLSSLINGVLDVSRIEAGKAILDLKSDEIYSSFIGVESTMQDLAESRDISIKFEYKNILNNKVLVDVNRCNRVFVNIISNAIKYSHEGGFVKVTCEQISKPEDGIAKYRYTFEDNGIGMSEDFQKHVFEQFTRENKVSKSGIQGTGLGMAVCKSFVELMNGTIECKSKLGEGTTITVVLPFKVIEEQKAGLLQNKSSEKSRPVFNKSFFKGQKVLVADDSEMNLEIAIDILTDEGFIVETAPNGAEVLKLLEMNGPDYYNFILMDIRMPVMGGYEATRIIREKYPKANIPIIALSANAFEEDKAASLAAGMDAHVAKPILVEDLFKILYSFIIINQ